MHRFVAAEAASAQRAEQMPQKTKSEEIDRFVRQLKPGGTRLQIFGTFAALIERRRPRFVFLCLNPPFFNQPADQLLNEVIEFLRFAFAAICHPLLEQALRNPAHFNELLDDGLPQGIKIVWIADIAESILKPALKKELRELIEELFQTQPIERRWDPLCVFCRGHVS